MVLSSETDLVMLSANRKTMDGSLILVRNTVGIDIAIVDSRGSRGLRACIGAPILTHAGARPAAEYLSCNDLVGCGVRGPGSKRVS